MNTETEKYVIDKLARLDGNVLAVCAALRGLILHQPDVDATTRAVVEQLEKLTAVGLGKAISDSMLEGIHEGRNQLLPSRRDRDMP